MKFLIMFIGAIFVGFVAWLTWPGTKDPTLFDLPPTEAYQRLTTLQFPTGQDVALDPSGVTASGDGGEKIVWAAGNLPLCNIRLAGEENNSKTRVAVDCAELGEGAAIAFTKNALRGQAIALVDATLKGYDYDPARVGQVASQWPDMELNPVKAYGESAGAALQMQSDMMREQAE